MLGVLCFFVSLLLLILGVETENSEVMTELK
jgi:hypothetical protein